MSKWEYGFLTRSFVTTNNSRKDWAGYIEIKFNGQRVAMAEIKGECSDELRDRTYLEAFNKLGNLGWELCTDNLIYYLPNGDSDTHAERVERIIFRRLVN
jgi:hypothetical protein